MGEKRKLSREKKPESSRVVIRDGYGAGSKLCVVNSCQASKNKKKPSSLFHK